jgi:hypothetical protein
MISITGVDLFSFAQKVYELSQPQGLGFLHDPSREEAHGFSRGRNRATK